jgi:hypothetical protein
MPSAGRWAAHFEYSSLQLAQQCAGGGARGTAPTDRRRRRATCAIACACLRLPVRRCHAVVRAVTFRRLRRTSGTPVIGCFSAGHRRGDTYQNPTATLHRALPRRRNRNTRTHHHVAPPVPLQRPGDPRPRNRRWLAHPYQVLLEPAPASRRPLRLPRPNSVQDSQGPEGVREGAAGWVEPVIGSWAMSDYVDREDS